MATSGAYLDHAASTPVLPEALDAMVVHLRDNFANPSGVYRQARTERQAVDDAREVLAGLIGCAPGEIVFTSGGTEADNLAVLGVERSAAPGQVAVSAIEHHAVLRPAQSIDALVAPVTTEGVVDLEGLDKLLSPSLRVVSVMAVNNEVGTVQPIDEVVALVREHAPAALVHCDAVQALAWCDVATLVRNCDLVTLSAHKVGGPKGIGALVVRSPARERIHPMLRGGAQERELRAGTENVASICGFATAASLTVERRGITNERVGVLRDRFVDGVRAREPAVVETAPRSRRIVANAHLRFPGARNEELLLLLDDKGVAASAGSACASGALEPSHVLVAMGMSSEDASSCVRFSLGATTTAEEIDYAIDVVVDAYHHLVGTDTTDR